MVPGNFLGKPVLDELKIMGAELNDTAFSSQEDLFEH